MADYRIESNLRQIAALSPEEQAASDRFERSHGNLADLSAEIRRQKDPVARSLLTDEYRRQTGQDVAPEMYNGPMPGATRTLGEVAAPAPRYTPADDAGDDGAPGPEAPKKPRLTYREFIEANKAKPAPPPPPSKWDTAKRIAGEVISAAFAPAQDPAQRPVGQSRGGPEVAPYVAGQMQGPQQPPAGDPTAITRDPLSRPAPAGAVPPPAEPGLSQQEMTEGSIAPWRLEQMQREAAYRDTGRSPVAKPFSTGQNIAQDVREATTNPVARGAVSGIAQLGQTGVGAVRLAADLFGADKVAKFAADTSRTTDQIGNGVTQGMNGNEKLVADITSSIINSVPAMAIGTIGGPALSSLFAQSTLAEYNNGRDAGFDTGASLSRAGIYGFAEALGERFGFPEQIKLLKSLTQQLPSGELAKVFGSMLMKEIPGEQLTTAMQFLADKVGPAALKPNASLADYLEAAGETLKVTIGQTLVMGGGPAAIGATRSAQRGADAAIDRSAQSVAERAAADAGFLRPTERRKQTFDRFDDLVVEHGIPPKAADAAKKAAENMPLAEVPGFMKRFAGALSRRMGRPLDDAALTVLDEPAPPAPPADVPRGTFDIEEADHERSIDGPPADGVADAQGAMARQAPQDGAALAGQGAAAESPGAPIAASELLGTPLDEGAHQAATSPRNDLPEPTPAQKEAGNYKVGRVRIDGLNVSIENPKGSIRRSKDSADPWQVEMPGHYGYIRGTEGADGDHVDLFIGDQGGNGRYWVINQNHPDGGFDEHKVITGANSAEEAVDLYKRSFADGFGDKVFGSVSSEFTADQIKQRLPSLRKPKPVARPARVAGAPAQPTGSGVRQGASGAQPEAPAFNATIESADGGGRSGAEQLPAVTPSQGAAPAPSAPRVIARAGRTPSTTEDIDLRANPDGTVTPHMGGKPMLDYDSGNPISLPAGVSDLDVKKAIRAAGAISDKVNFFPSKAAADSSVKAPPAAAPAPRAVEAPTPAPAAQVKASTVDRRAAAARERMAFNPETDSVLQAISKMGGMSRDSAAKEFGLKPEELRHSVATGGLKGYPFRKNGGRSMDGVIEALQEAGYFPGVADEDVRRALEEAIYSELGGGRTLTAVGQARDAERQLADRAQQEQDEVDAENSAEEAAERAAIMAEARVSEGLMAAHTDDDVKLLGSNASTERAMRELGFSDEEIAHELAREANRSAQAGLAQDAAPAAGKAAAADEARVGKTRADDTPAERSQEGLTLQAQSSADLEAKTQREGNADALDQRQQIDAERDQFGLQQQTAPEQRKDSTGDMFGGPSADDVQRAQRKGGKAPDGPDLFSEAATPKPTGTKPETGDSEAVKKAKADLMAGLGDLAALLAKPGRSNIAPEEEQKLLPILTKVFDAAFRLGYLKFKDAARFVLDQIRSALGDDAANAITLDHLQGAYIGMAGKYKAEGASSKKEVVAIEDLAEIEERTDAPDPNPDLERDRADPAAPQRAVEAPVRAAEPGPAAGAGEPGGVARSQGSRPADDPGVPAGGALAGREQGDQQLRGDEGTAGPQEFPAGADDDQRGLDLGEPGVPPETVAAEQAARAAESGLTDGQKRQAQRAAESIPVKPGDLTNIRATLPYLLPEQQDDVHKAESRLAKPDGYGMLFTNGTGTGKTFSGLGVAKRFARQGKTNQLFVVPDVKIMEDWVESAKAMGLKLTPLRDTKDAGKGLSITTYANLGENDALARRDWDLVTADEAHMLAQAKEGDATAALNNLRALTLHPRGAHQRYVMLNRDDIEAVNRLSEQITANSKIINNDDTMDAMVSSLREENAKLEARLKPLQAKLDAARKAVNEHVQANQGAKRPRAAFLSATPFAYEPTIDWAEGYLFDYAEGYPHDGTSRGYNTPDARQHFFMTHFGWRMRYNKLTRPDAKVDSGLLQRQFNGYLKKRGSLSGRMLEVKADYDRKFVLVDSAIGNEIDRALTWLSEQARAESEANKGTDKEGGFRILADIINSKLYNEQGHLVRRYLLEAIKAKEGVPIIRQHLALGRKLVVFHDFKKGGALNPFDLSDTMELPPLQANATAHERGEHKRLSAKKEAYTAALATYRKEFPTLVGGDALSGLISPIERFKQEFPDVLLINGDEKPRDLLERYKRFNRDDQGPIVALVQSDKNKGWSGHDTTGKYQRVLMNLGLPTQPTKTIQTEGRIYRTGQVSDAMFRYLNTGTTWEKWAFAHTIARRASEAENLGQGEHARALLDAFVTGFEESDAYPPGHEGEGKGGKERDRALGAVVTAWDRAKSYYWGTQKKNARTKAQEGEDYFATPEPVGLKMVQLLNLRGGESALEPSAGHGAIARWLPDNVTSTAVEPSMQLRARLALGFDGKIIDGRFEDLHVVNKFDGIAMNPPFGTAGRTAVDHVAKAATHLRDGGRLVALIPTGPSADKKFDAWFYGEQQRPVKPLGSVVIDGKETPLYKGDTIASRAAWAPTGTVAGWRDNAPMVKADAKEFRGALSMVGGASIKSVQPTGPRTETYRAAEGLHLVADIKLPGVTFERAGTGVMTRIVVIEKAEGAPLATTRDYTDIKDINELFDRLEDLSIPDRAKPIEAEPVTPADARKDEKAQKEAAKAAGAALAEQQSTNVVEHTTPKGKVIKGVIRTDLTQAQAKEVDPYTWKKDGGFFIRLEHLKLLNEKFPPPAPPTLGVAEPKDDAYTASHGPDPGRVREAEGEGAPGGSPPPAAGRPAGAANVPSTGAGAGPDGYAVLRGAGVAVPSERLRVVALGIAADIQRAGSTALVGREVASPDDLAELAQVYRDPRYETFRVFFMRGQEIVHSTGVSSRLPGTTPMVPSGMTEAQYLQLFRDDMARTGADGYYVLHNHPSGNPNPSREDLELTEMLAAKVPGLRAHVVINSNRYAVIQTAGGTSTAEVIERDFGPETLLLASKPSAFIGRQLAHPHELVPLGKSLQKPGWITLVGIGSDNRVRMLSEAPSSILGKSPAFLAGMVRRMMRLSGSRYMSVVGSDADVASMAVVNGIERGILRDAIGETGRSLVDKGVRKWVGKDEFDRTRGKFVAEPEAPYGEEREAQLVTPPALKPSTGILDTLLRKAGGDLLARITSPGYDKLLDLMDRGMHAVGGDVYLYAKAGTVADYGLTPDYKAARSDMQTGIRKGTREAATVIEQLQTLDRAQARVAYLWMQEKPSTVLEQQLMAGLPEESRETLKALKQRVDDLGRQAVDLGLLSSETYERNAMAYLHRSYQKYEQQQGAEKTMRSRSVKILGDQFKGRGLRDDAPPGRIGTPDWWQRRERDGQADTSLKGQKFHRLELRGLPDESTPDMFGGGRGRLGKLEKLVYWPEGEAIPQQYADWRNDGLWEARFFDKGGKVGMWRDFTLAERTAMGEIQEVRYSAAKTLLQATRDVETAKLLDWVARNQSEMAEDHLPEGAKVVKATESLTRAYLDTEWVQVPKAEIPGTAGVKRYGNLAGRFVPGPVWNDIRQISSLTEQGDIAKAYQKMLAMWKVSKTALSPATHTNNVMSNFILADAHDIQARHMLLAARAWLRHKDRGNLAADPEAAKLVEDYQDNGGDGGKFNEGELRQDVAKELLDQLERDINEQPEATARLSAAQVFDLLRHREFRQAFAAIGNTKTANKAGAPARALIKLYGFEDELFRLAAFIKARADGLADHEAGLFARNSFLDYSINAPWINALRRTAFPFIAFTYRAVPMLMRVAADKPHKLAKYALVAGALNALAYGLGGGDEDKERALLPDEKAGKIWGIFPKLLRMPWNDEHDSPVFLDVRRWVPAGDVIDTNANHAAVPVPAPLVPGGPLVILAELMLNKQWFTGKEITKDTDTLRERWEKVGDYLWKSAMPNFPGIPNTYSTDALMNAGGGKTDAFGREQSLGQAALSAVGVKVGSYPADVATSNIARGAKREIEEIKAQIRSKGRELARKGITQEEFDEFRERQIEKIKDVAAKRDAKLGVAETQ